MMTLTMASLWISSLILTGCAGWVAGQITGRRRLPLSRLASEDAGQALKTIACEPHNTQAPTADHPAATSVTTKGKRRARIFANMPPVETVRAQARVILKSESVWEQTDASEKPTFATLNLTGDRSSISRELTELPRQVAQPASSSVLV